jgi:hypothetical protein
MRQPKCSHTRQASQGKKKRNGPGRPWTLKLNCDATFLEATKSGGWGWLIRNSNGEVIIVGRGRVDHVHNPFQDEVISCMHGANGYLPLALTIWSSKLMHWWLSKHSCQMSLIGRRWVTWDWTKELLLLNFERVLWFIIQEIVIKLLMHWQLYE